MGSPEGEDAVALFAALADETRWAIVRELAVHRRDGWRPKGLSFADLRRAVGVRDAGRFNYHLEKLRGGLVDDDGGEYVLSNQGLELVGSVLAGAYDTSEDTTGDTTEDTTGDTRRETTGHACPRCDRPLEAIYEYGSLRLECPAHGVIVGEVVPARPARERPIDDLVEIAGRRGRARIALAVSGTCSHCWGRVEARVSDEPLEFVGPDGEALDLDDRPIAGMPTVSISCTDCGFFHRLPAHVTLVDHPAVVSFRYDHGDDPTGVPYLGSTLDSVSGAVVEADDAESDLPPEAAARIEFVAGDETLVVTLDRSAAVVGTDRR